MSNRILLTIFFTLTGFVSFSQFNGGVRGGFQLNNLYTNTDLITKWRPAYHVGVFGSYTFNKKCAIIADLLYSDKGHQSTNAYNDKIIYHRSYLNIPLIFQYSLFSRFSVLAGGEFGALLYSYSYSKYARDKNNLKDYYGNPIDIGIVGGIAYQISPRSNIMLRYIHGISNVLSKDATVHKSDVIFDVTLQAKSLGYEYHNQAIQLSLSYSLRKSKFVTSSVFSDSSEFMLPRFSFGFKAGLNLNNTFYRSDFPYSDESLPSFGLHSGLFFQLKLSKKISFIPEIQFIKKGYKYKEFYYYSERITYIDLYYLESPFILSYSPTGLVSVEAGPVAGLLLFVPKQSISGREDNYTRLFEFGLTGGLRFNVSEKISIACRYYRGMTNITNLYKNYHFAECNTNFQISTYVKLFQASPY